MWDNKPPLLSLVVEKPVVSFSLVRLTFDYTREFFFVRPDQRSPDHLIFDKVNRVYQIITPDSNNLSQVMVSQLSGLKI